jgi:CubicO group peptidase (beta-lactamase class C family)
VSRTDRRARHRLGVLLSAAALVVASCTGSEPGDGADGDDGAAGPGPTYPAVPFSRVDEQLEARVANDGLAGAVLVVEQDGAELHRTEVGDLAAATLVPVGEVGRWLTAVLAMTLVEEGTMSLDRPVGEQAPGIVAVVGEDRATTVTPRQLLSHTSGLPPSVDCSLPGPAAGAAPVTDRPVTDRPVTDCDAAIAASASTGTPGEVFGVSAPGYHALARLVEELGDAPFDEQVRSRLTDRLGMTATRFVVDDDDPLLGSDLETSADELGRFLDVVLARGALGDGTQLLGEESLRLMEYDETARLGTNEEPWVAWTGIPTFGLGVWRDRLRGEGTAAAVSAPGRFGAYPWVDRPRNAHGVLLVVDERDPAEAVGASAALAQQMGVAIDTEGRPLRVPGSPIPLQGD